MLFGRVSRIVFDIVGTLVVLLVIGAGALGWRLSQGPLPLNFLTPTIERALSDETHGTTVSVGDTVLAWGGWRRTFDVEIRSLRVLGQDGRLMLEVPQVSLSLSARGFLHGLVAPTSLDAVGIQLVLVRGTDGVWRFRASSSGEAAPSALPLLLEELLASPDPDRSLGYLRRASVFDSSVTLIDEVGGHVWVARDATIAVQRDVGGLRARISAMADISGKTATLAATGTYAAATSRLALSFDLSNLDPTALATADPDLGALAAVAVPLSGKIDLGFDPQFRLDDAAFDLMGQNGKLDAKALSLPQDAPVRRLRLRGKLPQGLSSVDIEEAQLDLGGPVVTLQGRVADLGTQPRASATVTVRNVPVDDLSRLWPHGAGENARRWITENLSGGTVGEAKAEFAASAPAAGAVGWTVDKLSGAMSFTGVEVNYLEPMPHVQGVDGEATFTRARMDITPSSGALGNLRLGSSKIALTALDTNDETAALDIAVSGPLHEALDLVDGPPLGYLKKIDLKADDFSGDATVRLQLKFPLKKDLKVDQLDVVATSDVEHLTMRQAALGQNISDGTVKVRVDRNGLDIGGQVVLGPTPATIDVHRNFADTAQVVGRIQAHGRMADAADWAAFGFDVSSYVKGASDVSLAYNERRGGQSDLTLDAKFDDAELYLPQLDWSKPAGQAATAQAAMTLFEGHLAKISKFTASSGNPAAGGLAIQGSASFAPDGKTLIHLDLPVLKAGLTDAQGSLSRSDSGLAIDVAGAAFNAGPLLNDSSPPDPNRPPLELKVDVGRLYFAADRWLDRLRFVGHRSAERWESADLAAQTGAELRLDNQVNLSLQKGVDGKQSLAMVADDAGAFLRAVDVTPNVVGGHLEITGATDDKRQGQPLAGTLHMSEYRVVRAPMLARLLSVALLTGIVDSLTGEGIRFAQLDADFAYYGSIVEITNARSAGPALGITAKGTVDIDANTVDLDGTIVPANALNSLPAKIPLLGTLLTGSGGGVFAATYTMTGPMSDVKVKVNPLSTLVPGFLRNLFGTMPGVSPTDALPESERQEQPEYRLQAPKSP